MTWSVAQNYGPDAFVPLAQPTTRLCGDWAFEGTIWPDDNDLKLALQCKGTAHIKLTAEGRFIHMEWSGTCNNDTWSGGTILGYASGPQNAAGEREMHETFYNKYGSFGKSKAVHKKGQQRIEFAGETHCFDRGPETYRNIIDIQSDNKFVMEVHIQGKGAQSKARHLEFTRA